jgi:AcrR family transcriptional regulator
MLSRHYVEGFRRERVAAAVAEIAHERGITATTGMRIIARAHISRNTFYDLFESRDDCLHFAFSEAYARLFGPIEVACEHDGAWLTCLSIAFGNLLAVTSEAPLAAELCLVHSWGAMQVAEGYDIQAGTAALSKLIAGGRTFASFDDGGWRREPSPGIEDLLAGAVVSLLARRLRDGEIADLRTTLLGDLVALVSGPFIGLEEAMRYGRELTTGE